MENRFYGLKNDYMFKMILQKCNRALRSLVAALLEIEEESITECRIENSIELGDTIDSKDCYLDVKVIINRTEIIDLELQVRDEKNWPERSLLYWSRAYDTIKTGDNYKELKKTYHIGILNYTLFDKNPEFYTEYKLMDTKTGFVYTDKLIIRILDLTKADTAAHEADNEKLIKWAKMFNANSYKELIELAGNDEVMQEMVVTIKELTEDEKLKYRLQAREKYECRMTSNYETGYEDGEEEGIEQGIKALVKSCKELTGSKEVATKQVMKQYDKSEEEAKEYVEKYWE